MSNVEQNSSPLRRRSRSQKRLAATMRTASTVLVASFLVVNSPQMANAAPSHPKRTSTPSSLLSVRSGFFDSAARIAVAPAFSEQRSAPIYGRGESVLNEGKQSARRDVASDYLQDMKNQRRDETIVAHTNSKRAATNTTFAATTRTVNSAQFTSNLANAWNPGRRSIWFQRKAVIITSIFLAIFIVLIIGCVVFLRGKRDEDMEEDYDVSDEAALARMREEREMRLGSRGEKKSKRRRRTGDNNDDDGSSTRRNSPASTTAILASKWGRMPTRKIRIRKTRSKGSSIEDEKAAIDTAPPVVVSDVPNGEPFTASLSATDDNGQGSSASMERTASDQASPMHASSTLNDRPSSNSSASQASSQAGPSRLNAADFAAAEEEEERLRNNETLPPAYISGHQRRPSAGVQALHSTAVRHLAGQGASGVVEARGDEKRAEGTVGGGAGQSAMNAPPSDLPATASPHGFAMSAPSMVDDGASSATGVNDTQTYAGHLATDDKNLLLQMRAAASRPDELAPLYAPSAPIGVEAIGTSSTQTTASAPQMLDESQEGGDGNIPSLPVHEGSASIMSTPLADEKGKAVSRETPFTSRLPAPPAQQVAVTFSPFDLPYENTTRVRAPDAPTTPSAPPSNSQGKEKEKEAADDAMALLASQPGDMQNLPRYEHARETAVPSAPAFDEDDPSNENEPASAPAESESSAANAPSAPPA